MKRPRSRARTRGRKPTRIRWNADPDDVERSVVKLVLSLVELLRKLMERQAIRRMEHGSLTPLEIERVGKALMKLEETVRSLARQFDIDPDDLNLDLVDSLLEKGVMVDGELVLGVADVDLVYIRLAALLAAVDAVLRK